MTIPQTFRFRFEFPSKEMAETAIVQLQMQQFTNALKWSDEGQKWVCTSNRTVDRITTPIEKVHAYLYTLIEACDGTYKGHEFIQENEDAQQAADGKTPAAPQPPH